MAGYRHHLPYCKINHIFFLNDDSESDSCWVKKVIDSLNVLGYSSGCITDNFNFKQPNSIFENIETTVEQSAIFAFVISQNSEKSKKFRHLLEIAVILIIQSDEEKPMLPILLDNTEIPKCLLNIQPLIATGSRHKWWPKLMSVVELHCSVSSSEESDEDLKALQEQINIILTTKSKRKQEKFRKRVSQSSQIQSTSVVVTNTSLYKRMWG